MKKCQRLIATLLAITLTLQVAPGWTSPAKPSAQACYDMLGSSSAPDPLVVRQAERVIDEAAKTSTRDKAIYALAIVLALAATPSFHDGFSLVRDTFGEKCYIDTREPEKTKNDKPQVDRMSGTATGEMVKPIKADVQLPAIPALAHLMNSDCAQPGRVPNTNGSDDFRTNPYVPLREAHSAVTDYLSSQIDYEAGYSVLVTVLKYSALALVLGASGYAAYRAIQIGKETVRTVKDVACVGAVCIATDIVTQGRISGLLSPRRPRN